MDATIQTHQYSEPKNMEDYDAAHKSRLDDIAALLSAPNPRTVMAAHLGGVAVECRLKALLLAYHQIGAWKAKSRRAGDTLESKVINRPGHSLLDPLAQMADLQALALRDEKFLAALNIVNTPALCGASNSPEPSTTGFIDARYWPQPQQVDQKAFENWSNGFRYVVRWLLKNGEKVCKK